MIIQISLIQSRRLVNEPHSRQWTATWSLSAESDRISTKIGIIPLLDDQPEIYYFIFKRADFKHEFLLAIESEEDRFNVVPLFQYNTQPGHVLSSTPGMTHII